MFNLGEVWKSVEGNGSRRAVVVEIDDDGRRGKLHFDDTGDEEWFLWEQMTQANKWEVATSPRPTRSADDTPVETSTGASIDWMNAGDAANTVARMMADRQRDMIAATQSGIIAPPTLPPTPEGAKNGW